MAKAFNRLGARAARVCHVSLHSAISIMKANNFCITCGISVVTNDISVGKKIRLKRKMMGMSQKQLGHHLGVTFQQIQKYEKGLNRVGAGRLQEIADILDVPISFFYADLATKENAPYSGDEGIASKEEYVLLKNFRVLKPKKQKAILWLIANEHENF